jgi:hypothetical protein
MRITVTIDDALYEKALEIADPGMDESEIFREAFRVFVQVQAAKRLAALGGSMPEIQDGSRCRQLRLVAQADTADTDLQRVMDNALADVDGWTE